MTPALALAPLPAELYWASAAAAAVFLVAGGRAARPLIRSLRERAARAAVTQAADTDRADNWLPPTPRACDRRRATRRGGQLVAVEVAQVPGGRADEGVVRDRSSVGLGLASDHPYPVGAVLYVRPAGEGDFPWVEVTVRSCRDGGDHYLVGVQFQREVPWNVLLRFG